MSQIAVFTGEEGRFEAEEAHAEKYVVLRIQTRDDYLTIYVDTVERATAIAEAAIAVVAELKSRTLPPCEADDDPVDPDVAHKVRAGE